MHINEFIKKGLENFELGLDTEKYDNCMEYLQYNIKDEYDIPIYRGVEDLYKKVLVLSGGGIKGVAYIGVFLALDELGYLDKFETYAGTSVGSLVIAMYLTGYKPMEIYEFIMKFDLNKLKSPNEKPFLQHFLSNDKTKPECVGLDKGLNIEYLMKRLIQGKKLNPNITLIELYEMTKKKIIFPTVCINTMEICYLTHETYPDLPLFKAVRMSAAIPIMYTAVKYGNYHYIDGGCIDNFPIKIFDSELDKVLGVCLIEKKEIINEFNSIETLLVRIIQCIFEGMTYNSKKGYEKYTVSIDIEPTSMIDYGLSKEKKYELFLKGYNSILRYLKN